jgi:predicted PurR-regulated permease PerM
MPAFHHAALPGRPIDPRSCLTVPAERIVSFRPRTVFAVIGIVLAVLLALAVVWIARQVLTWILVSIFLALALNPAVEALQRRGLRRRGAAAAVVYLATILAIVGLGSLFVPTLVNESRDFANALPGYVQDVSQGRGQLGELADRYQIEERVRAEVQKGGAARLLGLSGTAVAVTKSVLTFIVAVVTIAFMTLFMLLEGPAWVERFFRVLPDESRERWRAVGVDIYRTVGGYVTGNLLISLIAGIATTVVLLILGVPYAVALGLLVAILDLIPLAGATLAAIIVTTVAFIHSVPAGIIILIFFIVYQQIENHLLQPLVYSRTVQLSPLAILVSVLIGAKIAGILGALAAIPVAGTIQVLFLAWLEERRARRLKAAEEPAST